jgi:formate hydrogenlyase subunit 3/multisubunit Na+/H+ antiporter MnhD subunit
LGTRIEGLTKYKAEFSDDTKRKRAYDLALEIRKFEIELYWKRATYFWTLIAATFAGYFALASTKSDAQHPLLVFLASCIGLVLSTGWYLVNRGSKYWQQNWERHVDSLEDEFVGPLYKTTISNQLFPWWKLSGGYPFSVSRLNQLISLFIALVWLGISISSFPRLRIPACLNAAAPYVLGALTLFFVCVLIWGGRSGQTDKRPVDFFKSGLTS